MMIQGIVTAVSVGLGCGTCCGSGISAFLFGYLSTHAKNMKQSMKAFLSFYLGKILAVAAVCVLSSLIGRQILDEEGMIAGIDIHFIVDLCMVLTGIWLIIRWIREKMHRSCAACSHCRGQKKPETAGGKVNLAMLMGMGAGYGISPCAPLIMMAGYAATLRAGSAFFAGCVFAAASALAPMLILMLLTGVISSKIYREIPDYLDIFRLMSYILLVVVFAVEMLS